MKDLFVREGCPKIVVVGSCNADLVVRTPRLPVRGETVLGHDFTIVPGGKGANQAVAAARLGANVALVSRVGEDDFGHALLQALREAGVDTRCVFRTPDTPSGVALIMIDDEGENLIAVAPGANGKLAPEDIDRARDQLISADVLVVQLEIPMDTVIHAVTVAKMNRKPVILNPAPARPIEPSLLRSVTALTPNEREASLLTSITVCDRRSARRAARQLLKTGTGSVVLTMGSKGALTATRETTRFIRPHPVRVVDSTAAGDAFTGALAYAVARKDDINDAATFANAVAALSVTRTGAQPSMPTMSEVEAFLSLADGVTAV